MRRADAVLATRRAVQKRSSAHVSHGARNRLAVRDTAEPASAYGQAFVALHHWQRPSA